MLHVLGVFLIYKFGAWNSFVTVTYVVSQFQPDKEVKDGVCSTYIMNKL